MSPASHGRLDLLLGAGLAVLLIALYAATLLPGVGYGDTAKFQFVGDVLGTPHAPGYPTYVLLNHLWVRLVPWGSIAFRANLLSALAASLAALCVFLTLRALACRRSIALAGGALLGVLPPVWAQALRAEVYSLHLLFVAAVLLLIVRWSHSRSIGTLVVALGLFLVSFGNHVTTVCLAPAILLCVGAIEPWIWKRKRLLGAIVLLGALSFLQYGYLIWRTITPGAVYLETQANDLDEFLYDLSGAQHRWNFLQLSWPELLSEKVPELLRHLLANAWFLAPFVVLGILALRRSHVLLFVGLGIVQTLFAIVYTVPDYGTYLLPVFLALVLLAGAGAERSLLRRSLAPVSRALRALFCIVPLALALASYRTADLSQLRPPALETLAAIPPPALLLSFDYDFSMAFLYHTLTGSPGTRGVEVLHMPPLVLQIGHGLAFVERYLRSGQPFRTPTRGRLVPSALPVYVFTRHPDRLRDVSRHGLRLERVGSNLFRLRAGAPAADGREPLPRAFVVHELEAAGDLREAVARLTSAGFDPLRTAVVIGSEGQTEPADASLDAVEVRSYDDERIEIQVATTTPGWLVVSDALTWGWSWSVDGSEARPRKLNVVHWGVPLDPGPHLVEVTLDARQLDVGRWLGLTRRGE